MRLKKRLKILKKKKGKRLKAGDISREKHLFEIEMTKKRKCPVCEKNFTWRDTNDGQIHCSQSCALLSVDKHSGRPSAVSAIVLAKLIYAFTVGATDIEACEHAGISISALANYQKRNEGFKAEKAALKNKRVLKARVKVYNDIDKDTATAKWTLEKLRPKEYGNKLRIDGEMLTGEMDPAAKKRAMEILADYGEDD
jgi:hypothetical protein